MHLSDITDAFINRKFEQKIVARGFEYFHNGAVENAVLRGDALTAKVAGSDDEPYRVLIVFGAKDIASASCTCPYGDEWDGWCKHIAAVLLLCAHEPENVQVATPIDALLVALDREALESVLLRLAKTDAAMAEKIAAEAERLLKTLSKPPKGKKPVTTPKPNPKDLRKEVNRILGAPRYEMSYRQASAITDKISDLFEKHVEPLLNDNALADALIAMEALTDEYVNGWYNITAADDLDTVFPYIGSLWERAFQQSAKSLSAADRKTWKEKLAAWDAELSHGYGVDDTFTDALAAL